MLKKKKKSNTSSPIPLFTPLILLHYQKQKPNSTSQIPNSFQPLQRTRNHSSNAPRRISYVLPTAGQPQRKQFCFFFPQPSLNAIHNSMN